MDQPLDLRTSAAAYEIELARRITHLERALIGSRVIGAATGILMVQHSLSYAGAFERLRLTSQRTNRKVRDLAQEVVDYGTILDATSGPGNSRGSDQRPYATPITFEKKSRTLPLTGSRSGETVDGAAARSHGPSNFRRFEVPTFWHTSWGSHLLSDEGESSASTSKILRTIFQAFLHGPYVNRAMSEMLTFRSVRLVGEKLESFSVASTLQAF